MLNNPLRYIDPSGHAPKKYLVSDADYLPEAFYGITFTGDWSYQDRLAAMAGVRAVAGALAKITYKPATSAFRETYGDLELEFCEDCVSDGWGWAYGDHQIKFDGMYKNLDTAARFVAHELGHVFDRAVCAANSGSGKCVNIFAEAGTARSDLTGMMGLCANSQNCLGRQGHRGPAGTDEYWGFAGGWDEWQFGQDDSTGEVWADMFVGWTFNAWGVGTRGSVRQGYINTQMQIYRDLLSSR
jgi:hypothetical protein